MAKRIGKEEIDRFHDYGLHVPTRTIYLGSFSYSEDGGENGVDFAMTERFVKNMIILGAISEEPIVIVMNNPGGEWQHGIAIYDAIVDSKCHVTIKVFGMAMSMGAVIFQAADERVMAPNAKCMIHYGYSGNAMNHPKIINNWTEEGKKIDKVMAEIFLNKIREKHPEFKMSKMDKMLDFDTILSAKETVELGLADKILGEE